MKKILVVSKDGLNESLNENIEYAIEGLGMGRMNVEFCGVEISSDQVVDKDLVKWAEVIIVVEKWQRDALFQLVPDAVRKDVRVLDILEEDLENRELAVRVVGRILS
jgi:predicted protein tyrosine phosphatase